MKHLSIIIVLVFVSTWGIVSTYGCCFYCTYMNSSSVCPKFPFYRIALVMIWINDDHWSGLFLIKFFSSINQLCQFLFVICSFTQVFSTARRSGSWGFSITINFEKSRLQVALWMLKAKTWFETNLSLIAFSWQ